MKRLIVCLMLSSVIVFAGSSNAALSVYTDETAYLSALETVLPAGTSTINEGFENASTWGSTRSPLAADSIVSQGITWTSNHPNAVIEPSRISTSSGAANTHNTASYWGAFSWPHGDPDRNMDTTHCDVTPVPSECLQHDGLIGDTNPDSTLYAVGVWVDGTANSKVVVILDGNDADPVGFGDSGTLSGIDHQFIGLIETAGFDTFEFRETDGKTGDNRLVFFDDVTLAGNFTIQSNPNISVSPAAIPFGDVTVGNSSDHVVTVNNTGNADLAIGTIASVNALVTPFEIVTDQDNCSGQILTSASNCTVTVRFNPINAVISNDSFDIPSNDPDTPSFTVSVSGTGTPAPAPNVSVNPTSIPFGEVTVGNTNDQLVIVSNTGNADLTLGTIAGTNLLAAPFEVVVGQDNCSGQIITPSAGCTVTVRYAPTVTGTLHDSFDIPSDDPDTPSVTVNVSGTGAPVPTPNVSVTPTSFPFGEVMVGNTSDHVVTVTNTGDADLTIGTIASINPLVPPFEILAAQDSCSSQTLTPASNCTVTVRFNPAAAVISNDSFDIPSDDPDTPSVTVTVSGTGAPIPTPNISVTPTSFPFGEVMVGNTSDHVVTVTNTGDADLTIGTIASINPLVGPFEILAAQDGCSSQTLTPASNCTITVRFHPVDAVISNDSFDIPSNDPDTPSVTINVSGTGTPVPTPNVSVNPTSIAFGNVTVGNSSDQVVTVSNTGSAELVIGTITSTNSLATPFEIVAGQDTCSGQAIAPSVGCTVTVRFSPTDSVVSNDSFDIPSDDPDTPSVTINVSGTGTSVPVPNVVVSNTLIPFGEVTVGNTSDLDITVSNTGNADLNIGTVAGTNLLNAPFEIVTGQNNCSGQALTPASSCTVTVRFGPTDAVVRNDSFDIPFDDPDTPSVTINVSGTGTLVPTPNVSVTPTSIPFGEVTVGNTSDQLVTVSNTGNADLTINSIATVDPLVAPFELVAALDKCSDQILNPAASCTVTVRFSPNVTGILNDGFDIPSDDPDTPSVTVSVSGNGTPVPAPNISVTATSIPFGEVTVGNTSNLDITVSNTGNADLNIGTVAGTNLLAAPFEIVAGQDNCSGRVIAPSTDCTVTVRFSPIDTVVSNDSFDIPSDDPDTPSVTVSVSGTGLQAATNNPPQVPTLVYPANGQIDLPTSLTFRWKQCSDPEGSAVTYSISYCETNDFQGCLPEEVIAVSGQSPSAHYLYAGLGSGVWLVGLLLTVGQGHKRKRLSLFIAMIVMTILLVSACGGGGGSSVSTPGTSDEVRFSATGLAPATVYYWKIQASDGQDFSESSVRSFTTR